MAAPEPREDVFGPLIDSGRIELAVLAALKRWLPTYVEEARLQAKLGKIADVKSWSVVSENDGFPRSGLPALVVMAPQTLGPPYKDGAGFYSVDWQLNVMVTVSGARGAQVRREAQIYAIAVVGALMQRRDLGMDLTTSDWLGMGDETVSKTKQRTQAAAEVLFSVHQRNVLNQFRGPGTEEPPGPDEIAEITEVQIGTEIQ
jgi:hypothetical protein